MKTFGNIIICWISIPVKYIEISYHKFLSYEQETSEFLKNWHIWKSKTFLTFSFFVTKTERKESFTYKVFSGNNVNEDNIHN